MDYSRIRILGAVFVMLLMSGSVFAQSAESGSITGRVTQAGTALPGVTVEVRSPNLQGVRTAVTDAQGNFRFTLLPPGVYSLTATLSGFNIIKQQNIQVGLNRTVSLDVAMSAAVSETIVVRGAPPVVDVTSAASGANITAQTLQTLPIARNFTGAVQIAPGTAEETGVDIGGRKSDARGQATVYGSSGAENQYIIDGLNTTGVSHGLNVKNVNMEFIQEEEVMTGGLPAEYGRMTGGIVNAVTKSGSNEFHGDVFGYKAGGSFLSRPKYAAQLPTTSTTIDDISQQYDLGANLGGYILKDRLWFFGAYDRVKETDQSVRVNTALSVPGFSVPIGGRLPTDVTRDLYAAKLSLAITSSQLFNASVLGDPSKSNGAQFPIEGPPSTFQGINKTGGNDFVGHYSGVFGTRWNVNAILGRHKEQNILSGAGTTTSQLEDDSQVPTVRSGGFVAFDNAKYSRDNGKLDISSFWGGHTIKLGGDYEKMKTVDNRFYGGGDWVRKFCTVDLVNNTCPGTVYYTHEVFLNDLAPGFDLNNPATFLTSVANPLVVVPQTKNTGLYVQDSWRARSNLTLNAGIRYETQKVGDRFGVAKINLKNNWAPRLGAIWDPRNNGRSKAYVNFGRFYESIPMDINIREFGGEISLDVNNFDPASQHLTADPGAPNFTATGLPYRTLGGPNVPVDPNLKGQYLDEYLIGYDYEIASNLAVGIKGTYRNLGRVIEDMLIPAQSVYFVANPGTGLGALGGTVNGSPAVPVPKPTRRYKGVELHATKRFSNNYQFFTSYVWSRLTGNYDGTFQASTGQLDPNINSAYDYADFEVNNSGGGLLSSDRTHMFKLYGSYTVSTGVVHGLELGLATHWYSGTPLTAQGYAVSYRNWEYYLTPRGALGRGPANYEADVHVGYPVPVGGGHFTVLVNVFNILNRQAKTALDQRYNLSSDPGCSGIPSDPAFALGSAQNFCNGDGGIINAPGGVQPAQVLTNPKATATNPSFLTAGTNFTGQRSIRLGVRFTY